MGGKADLNKRDWASDAVTGFIVMISVSLALGAAIAGFFLGRDTKHPKSTAVAVSTQQGSSAVAP